MTVYALHYIFPRLLHRRAQVRVLQGVPDDRSQSSRNFKSRSISAVELAELIARFVITILRFPVIIGKSHHENALAKK